MGCRGRALMLGAGPLQVPAIKAAKEAGFHVICADYDPRAVGFGLADEASVTSTVDMEAVLELARARRVDFVITSTSDAPVRTAAYVSEKLGLPTGISYEDSICATHKDAMRDRLREHGVPVPGYRACSGFGGFADAVRAFGFDCVVKPADCAASRGVRLLDAPMGNPALRGLFDDTLALSKKGVVMVEERMSGPEVSVEALTVDGRTTILAVTDKIVTEPPYLVELGHTEPSRLPRETVEQVEQVARAAISAIGIENGPSHTEIMVTRGGPKVVETAARLGGDYITSKLVPLSTGVDLVGASVRLALGLDVDVRPSLERGAAIRFITSNEAGTLDGISFGVPLETLPGHVETALYLGRGERIDSPHSSNDRVGHVLFTGKDAAEAAMRADDALSGIRLTMRAGN